MKTIIGKIGDANFELFEKLPQLLYAQDAMRLKQKEQFVTEFDCDYVLILNELNIPQARAILFYNHSLQYQQEKAFTIGYFEAVNEEIYVNELFEQIKALAKSKHAKYLIGPMNGSTWEQHRFNCSNQSLFFTEYQHLDYYNTLFANAGFEVIANYYSNISTIAKSKITTTAREIEGVKIRRLHISNFENEIKGIFEFSLEVFKDNFLYTPISWESFYAKYLPIKSFINPDYVLLAERDSKLVGFLFAIHDFYNTSTKNIIVKTIARNPAPAFSGLASILGDIFLQQAQADQYEFVIHAFIHQHNKSSKFSTEKFAGNRFKKYELYAYKL